MAITAAMVKDLREATGAGMMDCKKALTATDGDKEKAVEWLREKGLATAQKKAGRIAAEGISMALVSEDGKKAVAVEVNSETDFVAKNEKFQAYVKQVAEQALDTTAADIDAFLAEKSIFDAEKTVADMNSAQIAVIGENLKIRRFARVAADNGFVTSYTHMGGKIVVLVEVEADECTPELTEMAKNVAMQAAAMRPEYCTRAEVSAEYLEKEKEVLFAAAKNEKPNAPDKVINGIVNGRLNKELSEVVLMDQVYVKAEDGKQSVQKYVDSVAKAAGTKAQVKSFVRFETGEGIEKKQEDFAAEVAAQVKG